VPDAEARTVSPGYFRTLQIPLKSGRLLDERDNEQAPRAAVISESLARKYFPGEDPVGKRITFGDPRNSDVQWMNVVGIVGDVRQSGLDEEPYAQVYRSYRQVPRRGLTVVVRTAGAPLGSLDVLRSQIRALDPQQPLYNVRTVEQVLNESIARPRFNMLLITILAAVALVLATVGIYGVISYMVTQRTHEIGIRMALGARPRDVFGMVLRQGLLIAVLGMGSGLVAAFAVTRLLASLLYDVRPTDVVTFAGVSALLTVVVLLACYIPARRATKVDPMIALRYE
ncbi:MAG TPA: FtsX-like permease family protein, partial [Pyrinomonadaceae bacterium]|nr:FtsX-like permease family protein [Pyrinomonadaceae bacterium]